MKAAGGPITVWKIQPATLGWKMCACYHNCFKHFPHSTNFHQKITLSHNNWIYARKNNVVLYFSYLISNLYGNVPALFKWKCVHIFMISLHLFLTRYISVYQSLYKTDFSCMGLDIVWYSTVCGLFEIVLVNYIHFLIEEGVHSIIVM